MPSLIGLRIGCGLGLLDSWIKWASVLCQRGECAIGAISTGHGALLLCIQLGLQRLLLAQRAAAAKLLGQLHANVARLRATESIGEL